MNRPISRRAFVGGALAAAAGWLAAPYAAALPLAPDDRARLAEWLRILQAESLARGALGAATARVGELATGAPYAAGTLEAYGASGAPAREPLTLHLDRFDCVTLVESALAVARAAGRSPTAGWAEFAREVERMRYRGGVRAGYDSRLHYFSEWIADNARRGLARDMSAELGGTRDPRPLRFMTEHRGSYPALRSDAVFRAARARERMLDEVPRHVIPTARIAAVQNRIQSGDVLAFATAIAGLDVTHTGLAYRDRAGVMRVLHAPLSGGAVEVS
ncbi:MAG TPA: N-acetylmuramoyl-L-alanine amidase-like domain-containing protein, partial [Longimicrobium sp.]|nr:N-acetylmuramoyl-L-alanine amidase-like domain-containing protein [Longimicrobium sp.]